MAGQPLVVGPYTQWETRIPSIRSVGFRVPRPALPPIVHAKLALLGHFRWHDEPEDTIWFTPNRLWISSANFTRSSRSSLDFGYWTEDAALLEGTQRFLLRLIASSEPIDAAADGLDPELAAIKYDDMAMGEALAEMGGFADDEDE